MKLNTLNDVVIHELKDLYSAENQIIKALPKMIEASTSEELQQIFEDHLDETKEQIVRLEKIEKLTDMKLSGVMCKGMEGLLKEGEELLKLEKGSALDAALVGAAQRVEHYEIAAYGSLLAHIKLMDFDEEVEELLSETLDEEKQADEKLSSLSEDEINENALSDEE